MITTIIPVYNGERFIGKTIESVLGQVRKPERIVVIDNASTDKTFEICKRYNVDILMQPNNVGMIANFNSALRYADITEYIHILCADDIILPDFYSVLVGEMEKQAAQDTPKAYGCSLPDHVWPGRQMAYCDYQAIDQDGQTIKNDLAYHRVRRLTGKARLVSKDKHYRKQLDHIAAYPQVTVIRTGYSSLPVVFQESGPDIVFMAQLGNLCDRIIEVQDCLCQLRQHGGSWSNGAWSNPVMLIENEWKAVQLMLDRPMFFGARWVLMQRAKVMLAIRAYYKRIRTPAKSREINEITKNYTRAVHRMMALISVMIRERKQNGY